jgi:hypothetical protein
VRGEQRACALHAAGHPQRLHMHTPPAGAP